MVTRQNFDCGAAKRCRINPENSMLAERCGPNGTFDPQREFLALPAPADFARLLKNNPDWPEDLRFATERARYMAATMRSAAAAQSQALQDLARRTFGAFVEKYRAHENRADH